MQSIRQSIRKGGVSRWLAAGCLLAAIAGTPVSGHAQDMLQLVPPSAEYALGGFSYMPPKEDGWRQISRLPNGVSLIYAEQKAPDSIDTRFGVTLEAHDIPPGTKIENPAALAQLSRNQMAEARKTDLVAASPVEAVPSVPNLYTYRLLVHSPIKGDSDAYEVYYVMTGADNAQYLVVQCITKTQEYGNELYFNQFYASLASLKYAPTGKTVTGEPIAPAEPSDKPAAPAAQ